METLPYSALNSVNSFIMDIILRKSSFGNDTVSGSETAAFAGVTELKLNIIIVKYTICIMYTHLTNLADELKLKTIKDITCIPGCNK